MRDHVTSRRPPTWTQAAAVALYVLLFTGRGVGSSPVCPRLFPQAPGVPAPFFTSPHVTRSTFVRQRLDLLATTAADEPVGNGSHQGQRHPERSPQVTQEEVVPGSR